jgi:hypothetical protein
MAQNGQDNGWRPARLIPTVGIRGQEEQEKRATSSLLAVMRAVPEFGHALVGPLGAPKGRIAAYAEVQLKDPAGKTHIPDGAIVVERGKTSWCCLVEVKTGTAALRDEQVNRYLDIARENRFNGVLTISNQITGSPTDSPVSVDGRKLRSVRLFHLSWWRILTEAIVQHRHRDIADRWEQFVEYLCLGLGQDLGRDVRPVRPRKQTATIRLEANCVALADTGVLETAIRVPDAVGPLHVEADLRTRKVITSVVVGLPPG